MSEIEVGEYVRLNAGKIGKVIFIEKGSIMLDIESNRWVGLCCIKSHSKDIIDLIEVGDIVNILIGIKGNAKKITQKFEILSQEMIDEVKKDDTSIKYLLSILTHEQYEANCYEVGEQNE